MEVDLLTNALLPNVEAASGRVEPFTAKPVGGSPNDSSLVIEQGEALAGENNEVTASSNLDKGKPSKDFAETLEEKMHLEAPETAENTESIVPQGVENVPSSERSQAISSAASADLFVEMDKIAAETPDIPQDQVLSGDSQLPTAAAISTPLDITAAQAEAAAMPASMRSGGELTELTVGQGQVQTQSGHVSQGMPEVTEDAQTALNPQVAQISQVAQQDSSMEGAVVEEETAVEKNTGELPQESPEKGDSAVMPAQKFGDVIGRNYANADPAPQDSADAGREASSEPEGDSAKTGSGVTVGVLNDAREKTDSEEQTGTLPKSSENSGKNVFGSEEGGSTEPGVQKLDSGHIQSVVSKSNGPETPAPQADNSPEVEQAAPAEAPQASGPEQPLSVQPPNSSASPLPGDNTTAVSEQIRESITSSTIGPDREITIRLNPPELGTVVVKFQEQDDQITGLLEVSKSQTRAEIQQVLPEITRGLQDFGVQIRRIEVVMASEGESETLSGQSAMPQDDRWAGQEGPQGFESNEPGGSVGGVFPGNTAYAGSDAFSRSYITDKAIDMFA